tara:strand:- start:583 stop:1980 length:1398 start_codon:yes stop_codon:yes gene_type:complete
MDEVGVIEPLIDGNQMALQTRRAVGCVSHFHANILRKLFAERKLHVSDCDRLYGNVCFVKKRMLRMQTAALHNRVSDLSEHMALLCVKGETTCPELRLDNMYWSNTALYPIDVTTMLHTTVYFLSRILAELVGVAFTDRDSKDGDSKLCLTACSLRATPYSASMLLRKAWDTSKLYTAASGVNENHAVHSLMAKKGCNYPNPKDFLCATTYSPTLITRRWDCAHLDLSHRILDEDSAWFVAAMIRQQTQLRTLDLGSTSMHAPAQYAPSQICVQILLSAPRSFLSLSTLDLSGNHFTKGCTTLLTKALQTDVFPVLEELRLNTTRLCSNRMYELCQGFAAVRDQLKHLQLNSNDFGWLGLSGLMSALSGAKRLNTLQVVSIGCSPGAYERLAVYVKEGKLPALQCVRFLQGVSDPGPQHRFKRAHQAINLALSVLSYTRTWDKFIARQCDSEPLGYSCWDTGGRF